jgi:hypothetical protein
MTPERKKKLRTLLRKKAVEELKKEQVSISSLFYEHIEQLFTFADPKCAKRQSSQQCLFAQGKAEKIVAEIDLMC